MAIRIMGDLARAITSGHCAVCLDNVADINIRRNALRLLTRYNKKTVTVITDGGQQWNVAPSFLRKAEKSASSPSRSHEVIHLGKK